MKSPARTVAKFIVVLFFLFQLNGCGTIIHGRKQSISVTSNPPGAHVLKEGRTCGVTPCTVEVSRRPLTTTLLLQKEGYQNRTLILKNGVSMWALLGNAVIGGIPGWIIDAASGSFGAYYKDSYEVNLEE